MPKEPVNVRFLSIAIKSEHCINKSIMTQINHFTTEHTQDGLAFYEPSTYRHARLIMPISAILSVLVALFR